MSFDINKLILFRFGHLFLHPSKEGLPIHGEKISPDFVINEKKLKKEFIVRFVKLINRIMIKSLL